MKYKITSFVITESKKGLKSNEEILPLTSNKSAPHYFSQSIPAQFLLGNKKVEIEGNTIELVAKMYKPDIVLVEGSIEVSDIFTDSILDLKTKILSSCHAFSKQYGGQEKISEEYTIYQVSDYLIDPENFLTKEKDKIAELLKSEKVTLDETEIDYTLSFQFKYDKNTLMIVDWDGAFAFDPSGVFVETIELFELANYQLLRYRILDQILDNRIVRGSELAQTEGEKKWQVFPSKEITDEFRELINIRSRSIAQFEALDRDIKLIGDWYFARLYELISKKFRLEGWSRNIREKLESLQEIYTIAGENLGMSRTQRLELIQIWGFFILQIGWLVLIVLEFIYFTR